MKRPSPEILTALAGLEHDPRFQRVLGWLTESLAEQDERNRALCGEQIIGRGQGEALCLATIIETATLARASLEKLRTHE